MGSQQHTFSDVRESLHPIAKQLLSLPDYGQVDENLVNMSNFFPLIKGLIEAAAPSSICEIGSDQGMTTQLLREYCEGQGCKLHSVDPAFSATRKIDDVLSQYNCLSIDYLKNQAPSEVYFLDGDHNYYTMATELQLIHENKIAGKSCLVFIHDVGWPWGGIDMFYNNKNIPEDKRKQTQNSPVISMYKGLNEDEGRGLPMNGLSVALEDQGKSGVVTAIEDFMAGHAQWQYVSIPSIFGLGVLACVEPGDHEVAGSMNELRRIFDRVREFLAILEFNRIFLLENINHAGAVWSDQQETLEKYSDAMERFKRERVSQLEKVKALEEKTDNLESELKRMSSLTYWLKCRFRGFRRKS